MKSLKKFVATIMFIFAGLPLSLGGFSLISTRALIKGPELYSSILADSRTQSLIQTIEAPAGGADTFNLDGLSIDSRATILALREVLPPSLIVETLDNNIASFFKQVAQPGDSQVLAVLDINPVRNQLLANSGKLLEIYLDNAGELPPELLDSLAGSYPQSVINAIKSNPKAYQGELAPLFKAQLETMPGTVTIPLPPDTPAGSLNLAGIQKAHGSGVVFVTLTGLMLMMASAFIKEQDWRKRAISLGSMIMIPGTIILVLGVIPFLINPAGLIKQLPDMPVMVPELVSFAKFAGQKLMGGFLVTGIVSVAAASGLMACRFLPAHEEDQE